MVLWNGARLSEIVPFVAMNKLTGWLVAFDVFESHFVSQSDLLGDRLQT